MITLKLVGIWGELNEKVKDEIITRIHFANDYQIGPGKEDILWNDSVPTRKVLPNELARTIVDEISSVDKVYMSEDKNLIAFSFPDDDNSEDNCMAYLLFFRKDNKMLQNNMQDHETTFKLVD